MIGLAFTFFDSHVQKDNTHRINGFQVKRNDGENLLQIEFEKVNEVPSSEVMMLWLWLWLWLCE